MRRRDFHRVAGLAAGGLLVPRAMLATWSPALVGIPRFQLATSPAYGAGDLVLDVDCPVSDEDRDSVTISGGAVHFWRIHTDQLVHYHGRLEDGQRFAEVVEMVNTVTIPFLNALYLTNVAVQPDVPLSFDLGQNYPNPFNPSTTIPYVLEAAGPAQLRIYDVAGRVVTVLVDGAFPAGRYEAHWSAKDLPSGTYLAVLRSGGRTRTMRLTLLK